MKEYFTVLETCKEIDKSKYQIRRMIKIGELEVKPVRQKNRSGISGQVGRNGYQILASSIEAWKIRQAEIETNAEPPPILFTFRARMTRKEFQELGLTTSERATAFREFAEQKAYSAILNRKPEGKPENGIIKCHAKKEPETN